MLWHVDIGALTLHNRSLDKLQFPGGYVSFNADTIDGWHYYIQDYMGNVRMVMNSDGTVEQKTHYYPYGGVIGYLSTNHDHQLMKFEGKELDRQFGLDWYDIHARQYDAIGVPSWNKVDALAEKNPHLSPYVFAGGNPVNIGDYDGRDTINISCINGKWSCLDPTMSEGNDVFVINYEGRILTHVFNEGNYGERICQLYLNPNYNSNNGNVSLLAYHVSGAAEGCTGFMATPAGERSTVEGSNKSMPDGDYSLRFYSGQKWTQPGIDWAGSNLTGNDRSIRYHNGKNPSWTQGCYVFLNNTADWNQQYSIAASQAFDMQMGAVGSYVNNGRVVARYSNSTINYKAYVRTLDYSYPKHCNVSSWFNF